ncbi:hypothetical protein JW848_09950, partial [Candidatus Bipolaricaulota bacterium]|nr:hypothetical protein [Candidatus Bipolaricaulota bacterium]
MVLGQGKLASVRVSVVPRGEQAETFIGIASTEMIDAYLEDVLHHEITSLSGGSGEFDVIVHSGQTVPAIPVDQEFWLASTIGNSEPLIWSVGDGGGNIAFVMMNSDASPTVDATV